MSSTAVEVQQRGLMPALSVAEASERYNLMLEYTKTVMVKEQDYGVIPGVSKPCLFKAGAEKLCTLFGMTPTFTLIERVEDWTGKDHGGEPFFYYFYKCSLVRIDHVVGEGDGSCNSWEKKYRYREGKRKCPICGVEGSLILGKPEFEKDPRFKGGYLCFAKKGGCGQKFQPKDPSIESQQVASVPNPDIAEQVNTIQKMAQKRALVAATLIACNASAFYSQDVDDLQIIDVEYQYVPPSEPEPRGSAEAATEVAKAKVEALGGDASKVQPPAPRAKRSPKPKDESKLDAEHLKMVQQFQAMKAALNQAGDGMDLTYYSILDANGFKHCNEIKDLDLGRAIYKQMKDSLIRLRELTAMRAEIAETRSKIGHDEFWRALAPVGIGDDDMLDNANKESLYRVLEALRAYPVKPAEITDDDLPSNLQGTEPEYRTRLRKCQEVMIGKFRAGGRFIDYLGLLGYERIEDVPTKEVADDIIAACDQYMTEKGLPK